MTTFGELEEMTCACCSHFFLTVDERREHEGAMAQGQLTGCPCNEEESR